MTADKKHQPREWWIVLHPNYKTGDFVSHSAFETKQEYIDTIHVIEKSAFDQLKSQFDNQAPAILALIKERDELKKEVQQLKTIDALESTHFHWPKDKCTACIKEIDQLRAQLKSAKEVIEWYAEPSNVASIFISDRACEWLKDFDE